MDAHFLTFRFLIAFSCEIIQQINTSAEACCNARNVSVYTGCKTVPSVNDNWFWINVASITDAIKNDVFDCFACKKLISEEADSSNVVVIITLF